jgi:hypothetical protein
MRRILPYDHIQTAASSSWSVQHNLGCNPVVETMVEVNGVLSAVNPYNVEYPDLNTVVISFTSPQSGKARLL